jgi:hypothetical protein
LCLQRGGVAIQWGVTTWFRKRGYEKFYITMWFVKMVMENFLKE